MDGQRLHADVRRAAADRCRAGRPVRAPAAVRDRRRDLHGGVRGGRAGSLDPGARRRPGRSGRGRRDRHAADADHPLCRCPARAAAGSRWASGAASAVSPSRSGRWSAARSSAGSPGTGSSGSTCRSGCCSCRSSACGWTRRAGPSTSFDLLGLALGERRPRRDRVGSGPRQRGRLDLPADHRRLCRRRRAAVVVRRVGAAHRAPDAPDALLRQPDVRAGQHRQPVHVLRDVRLDLLDLAVLPDRAGPTRRFSPGCGSCRGRRCRCSSRRSPARSQTASAGIG